ncbi:choice-of-anchor J domain-containing protein [Bacteroidota bacterium]
MKRPFLLLVCLFFLGFTYSQTVVEIYSNDFDSYTAGDYMGVVDPDNWEPWGGVPGAGDDAMVTDAEANTAPNSIAVDEVGGATDAIWKLGDKTSGVYWASWNMFVQSGAEGYFNFQKTEIPGTEWAVEVFFYTDLTFEVVLSQTTVATGTYTADTWFSVETYINLDNDMAECYIDGTLAHSWTWSNGGLLQLGGVDFYAGAGVVCYIDDVLYEQVFEPIYCDDFDQYTAGDWIADQDPTNWATWGNAPGTPEDGLISDAEALTAPNSVLCEGAGGLTDLVLKLGDKTSGVFEVDWSMFIPAGALAYYNFQKTETPGTEWAFEIYFEAGTGDFQIDQTSMTTFTYPEDTWFEMHHVIDLDADMAECYIDGTLVHSWTWSNAGLLQLGGVDFFTSDDTYTFYFDDVCYIQTGGSNDPAIAVTPSIFQKIVEQNTTQDDVLNIENTGGADLIYDIAIVYDVTKDNTVLPDPKPLRSRLSPSDFEAVPSHGNAAAPTDDVTLNWDGDNGNSVGLTGANDWEAAAMFPSSMISQYAGMELTYVDVFINDPDPADAFEVRIYGMESDMVSGPLLYSQAFTPTTLSWNTITLTTPVVIDGQDIWIAIWVDQTTLTHPIGADLGPAVAYGDYIKTGQAWGHLFPGIDGNWNIRGTLTGTPINTWLDVDPYMGTVTPGNMDQLDVTFDANGMATGTYQATIFVQSNANQTPIVSVPATMVVTPGGPPPSSECIDFDQYADWTLDFNPWMGVDVDGSVTYGFTGITFPGTGDPMAFINFNPATTTPPMSDDPEIQPHTGDKFGACMASVPSPTNDDWFISPMISLGANSEFNFWVKSYTADYGLERYNVAISTTGNTPADFTLLNTGGYLEAPADMWENQVWDISMYDGQDVYVAIQCVSSDAFVFMIDDVCVNFTVGVNEINTEEQVFIYPNPTTTHFNIDATSTIKEIRVYNYTGQLVDTKIGENKFETIYTSTYEAGIYFIQVTTEQGVSTSKVVIK